MTEQYWARKRLQLIAEASRRIGSTLDVTRTAQELADMAVPDFADFISVDLLASLDDLHGPSAQAPPAGRALQLRRIAHQSVLPGSPEAVVAPGEVDEYPEGSPPVESLRSGRAVLYQVTEPAITDWVAQDPLRASRIRDFGIHSAMTVPLSARGTTLGVAVFVRHRHPEPFQQDDLVLAEELSARAAVSIDNALRYTRERGTAVTLQRSLLPQSLPEQAAVEVASRYLPAGARAGVGGDWFDVIPLSGARVALVVGDVVGHGIHASATMGRLRTAVRTLADIDLPPDELLTHLDDLVARLATEAEAGAEPDAGEGIGAGERVRGACRGGRDRGGRRRDVSVRRVRPRLPPVHARPGGAPAAGRGEPGRHRRTARPSRGPPAGPGRTALRVTEIELPEGSLLALYTDGLIESRHEARRRAQTADLAPTSTTASPGCVRPWPPPPPPWTRCATGSWAPYCPPAHRRRGPARRPHPRTRPRPGRHLGRDPRPRPPSPRPARTPSADWRAGVSTTRTSSPNWSSANWSPTPSGTPNRPSSCG